MYASIQVNRANQVDKRIGFISSYGIDIKNVKCVLIKDIKK